MDREEMSKEPVEPKTESWICGTSYWMDIEIKTMVEAMGLEWPDD